MDRKTGIDLGTSRLRVCIKGRGTAADVATAAAFDGEGQLCAYGDAAYRMLGKNPPGKDVVTPLSRGVISNFEDCVELLSAVLTKIGAKGIITRPKTVISVPYGITEVECNAFENVCVAASGGRDLYMLVKQPMAAAIGCGADVLGVRGRLICDIGAGKVQTSVIMYKGIAAAGMERIGGDTADDAIVRYVKDSYNITIGKRTAESIKIAAGSAHRLTERGEVTVCGRNILTGQVVRATLYSSEIREAITPVLDDLTDHIKSVLEKIPPTLSSDVYESGLTLCGGFANLPGLDMFLREKLGMNVNVTKSPELAVIRGTETILGSAGELIEVVSAARDYQ